MYACAPETVAQDGGSGHTPFVEALLDVLPKSAGVELGKFAKSVRAAVHKKTFGQQLVNVVETLLDDLSLA
jgi:hypothetical protein